MVGRRVDDGLGDRKKKEKKGFKEDRRARFIDKHRKETEALMGKKVFKRDDKANAGKRVKELKFDDESRKEFLLTMHKKKNERRVNAMVLSRRKKAKENTKFRQQEREAARLQYNSYAKVPILPDYTFKLTQAAEVAGDDDGSDDEEVLYDDGSNAYVTGGSEGGPAESDMNDEVANVFAGQAKADRTSKLSGLSLHTSSEGDAAVTVDVQPLFGGRAVAGGKGKAASVSGGGKNKFAGGLDFSDLPSDVASQLEKLMKDTKGPGMKRAKVNMVKEMQKFHKIQKHSRKKKK
jgi:hypothetical protein